MSIRKITTLVLFSCLFLSACNNDDEDPVNCTLVFVYGLNVTLKDVNTGEVITEEATVIARDGDYEEELMLTQHSNTFVGAGERPGTYIIEVIATEYQPHMSSEITLRADECHVIPETLEFLLVPN